MWGNIFADTGVETGPAQASGAVDLAFGPPPGASQGTHPLYPDDGFAWAFWLGVAGLVVLVALRRSLPA